MAGTIDPILQQYVKLTEFLGLALGPDYEVALHDLTDRNHSIIAIANGHISGRKAGAPLTNVALGILRDKSYETMDYRMDYRGTSASGAALRSSTMFIKKGGQLIGMLCINFDDSRHRELASRLMSLCHPGSRVSDFSFPGPPHNSPSAFSGVPLPLPGSEALLTPAASTEEYRNSTDAVVADAIERELNRLGVEPSRLTAEEKHQIICNLEASGIFLLKGAVKTVAQSLGCSQPTVYRCLRQAKENSHET